MRATGQAHVLAHHTYRHRLANMMAIVFPDRCEPLEEKYDQLRAGEPLEPGTVLHGSFRRRDGSTSDTYTVPDEPHVAPEVTVIHDTLPWPDKVHRLELGSGYDPTPGFLHLDLNPAAPGVDVVGSAWPLTAIPDGVVDEIRAVDVLEHLSYWDTPKVLADWARVMRPEGRLYVQVPDAETIMNWFVRQPQRLSDRVPAGLPRTPLAGATWRLLGGHLDGVYAHEGDDFRFNAHYSLFSRESLTAALVAAGFYVDSITVNAHPNLCVWAVRP